MSQTTGIPALLNTYDTVAGTAELLVGDAEVLARIFEGPQWGIFEAAGNAPLLYGNYTGAAVAETSFAKEWTVATFPVEQGGFASYDKVENPYEAKVTISVGGTMIQRQQALINVQYLASTLTLVNVVTPEVVYPSANVIHYDYDRTGLKGAGLLNIDVWLEEIRITATETFSNTSQANGSDAANGGTVQPSTLVAAKGSGLANALDSTSGAGSYTDPSTGVTWNFGPVQ